MNPLYTLITDVAKLSQNVGQLEQLIEQQTKQLLLLTELLTQEATTSQELLQQTNTATSLLQSATNRNKKSMWPEAELVVPDVISSSHTNKAPDHGQQTC